MGRHAAGGTHGAGHCGNCAALDCGPAVGPFADAVRGGSGQGSFGHARAEVVGGGRRRGLRCRMCASLRACRGVRHHPVGRFGGAGAGAFLLLWQRRFALLGADAVSKLPFLALALSSGAYLLLAGLPKSLVCPAAMASACVSALLFAMVPCGAPPHGSMSKAVPYAPFDADMVARDLKNPIICVAAMAAAVLLTRFVALGVGRRSRHGEHQRECGHSGDSRGAVPCAFRLREGRGAGRVAGDTAGLPRCISRGRHGFAGAAAGGAALATSVAALAYAGFAVLAVTLMSASVAIAASTMRAPSKSMACFWEACIWPVRR